jgi:hypothetical protein
MSRPEDLELLEADVRASAPRMSPELERRLEAIVARPERRRVARWRPALAVGLAGLLIAVVVVAVGRSRDDVQIMSRTPSGDSAGSSALQTQAQTPAPPSAARLAPAPVPARRVEHDAALTLAAPSRAFSDVTDQVVATTDRFRGIVQRSTIDAQGRSGRAEFDLRIPASRLEPALAALSRLAHVRSRSAGTVDVTGAFNAAAARRDELQAERRGLLRALARATTEAEVASVKARLRDVGQRLARARRTVARLRARTDLARVHLTVVATRQGAATGGDGDHRWTPGDAVRDALRVLEVVLGAALVALAVAVPLGLLAGLVVGGSRLARRRRREAALVP